MGQLDGKVAVITGVGGGIGKSMAEAFVAEGAKVVVSDITAQEGEVAGLSSALRRHHRNLTQWPRGGVEHWALTRLLPRVALRTGRVAPAPVREKETV